jgi:hypothetical protein
MGKLSPVSKAEDEERKYQQVFMIIGTPVYADAKARKDIRRR